MTKLKDVEKRTELLVQRMVNNQILQTYFENPERIAGTLKIATERTTDHLEQTRRRIS